MRRVAIVTEATSPVGSACAVALVDQGFTVVVCNAPESGTIPALEATPRILAKPMDLRDLESCLAEVAAIEAQVGPIAVLVNKGGIASNASFATTSRAAWAEAVDSSLGNFFNMARAVWTSMAERAFGRIVNFGTLDGQRGRSGGVSDSAAQSGVHGFTKALALEGGRAGITVNMLAMGHVEGDMAPAEAAARIPVGRLARPEEIARAVLFLCSDQAGYITGSTLSINGGEHMF
ncbi:MAG: SDR family oxidoreductase [Sphingomicrobium sp.]